MRVFVRVFAVLKDHFEETFERDWPAPLTAADVLSRLSGERPEAADVLHSSRVALEEPAGDRIVPKNEVLEAGDGVIRLCVLPPSSGG